MWQLERHQPFIRPRKDLYTVLLLPLRKAIDGILIEEQTAFRKGRGCVDQVFVLVTHIYWVELISVHQLHSLWKGVWQRSPSLALENLRAIPIKGDEESHWRSTTGTGSGTSSRARIVRLYRGYCPPFTNPWRHARWNRNSWSEGKKYWAPHAF